MKIAVYTIALNEEQFVEKWYNSAKEADYLLIADTGSTDKTIELAESLGINIVNISVSPWRFDDARNAALAALPKDIDMCVSLDMDEILLPGWRDEVEKSEGNRISYKYTWNWKNDDETIPEYIFTNDKIHSRYGYRWNGLVHEYLKADRTEEVVWYSDKLEIHHHPDKEKSRSSYDAMIEIAMNENPHSSRYVMYYAKTNLSIGKFQEAEKYFNKALECEDISIGDKALAYRLLAICNKNKTVKFLKKSILEDPQRREGYVLLSMYFYQKGKFQKSYKYAKEALKITKKILDMGTDNFAWGYLPYNLFAVSRNNKKVIAKLFKSKRFYLNPKSMIALNFDMFDEVKKSNSEVNINN